MIYDYRTKTIKNVFEIDAYEDGPGIYLLPNSTSKDNISIISENGVTAFSYTIPGSHEILLKIKEKLEGNSKIGISEDFMLKTLAVAIGHVKDLEL